MDVNTRHWHGYEWAGPATDLREDDRRIPHVGDPTRIATFLRSPVPPVQVGHWLWRRDAAAASHTWTDVDAVLAWMTSRYHANPPNSRGSYVPLEARQASTRIGLGSGVDGWWLYYGNGGGVVLTAALCCPHSHIKARPGHTTLCPLPPS